MSMNNTRTYIVTLNGAGPLGESFFSRAEVEAFLDSEKADARRACLPACLPPACVLLLAVRPSVRPSVRLDLAFFPEFVPGLRGLDAADGLDRRRLLARLRTKLGQAAIAARERGREG